MDFKDLFQKSPNLHRIHSNIEKTKSKYAYLPFFMNLNRDRMTDWDLLLASLLKAGAKGALSFRGAEGDVGISRHNAKGRENPSSTRLTVGADFQSALYYDGVMILRAD